VDSVSASDVSLLVSSRVILTFFQSPLSSCGSGLVRPGPPPFFFIGKQDSPERDLSLGHVEIRCAFGRVRFLSSIKSPFCTGLWPFGEHAFWNFLPRSLSRKTRFLIDYCTPPAKSGTFFPPGVYFVAGSFLLFFLRGVFSPSLRLLKAFQLGFLKCWGGPFFGPLRGTGLSIPVPYGGPFRRGRHPFSLVISPLAGDP